MLTGMMKFQLVSSKFLIILEIMFKITDLLH